MQTAKRSEPHPRRIAGRAIRTSNSVSICTAIRTGLRMLPSHRLAVLGVFLASVLASGCAATAPADGYLPEPSFTAELAHSTTTMRLGEESGFGTIPFDSERSRTEVRLDGGSGTSRGYFLAFEDQIDTRFEKGKEYVGLGGGLHGTPTVATTRYGRRVVLPYGCDVGLGYSGDDFADQAAESYFFELRAAVGVGIEIGRWRPEIGVATSAIAGYTTFDDAGFVDEGFTGMEAGGYASLEIDGEFGSLWIRAVAGDLERFELGARLGL